MASDHRTLIQEPGETRAPVPATRSTSSAAPPDLVFLAAVVALSCVVYVSGLGLYSDDHSFLAHLHAARDGSFGDLFLTILADNMHARPVQALNLAVLYRLFGLDPLGYHLVNSGVLLGTVLLFHVLLRRLGVRREMAVAIPLVFGLLPHYSTDRLWIAAFQANLAVFALFVSALADLRFVRSCCRDRLSAGPHDGRLRALQGLIRWGWKILGTVALLFSVLAYEVTGPLFLFTPFVVWYGVRARTSARPGRSRVLWILLATNVAALGAVMAYKASVSERTALAGGYLWRALAAARGSVAVAFGDYGLELPGKVARALGEHFDPLVLAVSLAVGLASWLYLSRVVGREERPFPGWRAWVRLLVVGGLTFGLGYGVALFTWDIVFDTTGVNNRTAIAAALGAAMVMVSLAGLLGLPWRSARSRWRSFHLLIAALAFSGCLLVNTIASFWVEAAEEQRAVVEALREALPDPAPGTRLLLDGFCSYHGPGIVFEASWGVRGMLAITYGDATLRGDVLRESSEPTAEGIRTSIYGDVVYLGPYGEDLQVFRVDRGTLHRLETAEAARRYFDTRAAPSCPPGREGHGARIF